MRLFKFNNFEFNRGLRPSYRSPQRALLVFVGGAQAANAFFHHSGWAWRPCKLGQHFQHDRVPYLGIDVAQAFA